jgi:hypothetical protein
MVTLDDRDLEKINQDAEVEEVDDENQVQVKRESLESQVILRTVDNFQGEAATIIILSLVRSDGTGLAETDEIVVNKSSSRASIGFLKVSSFHHRARTTSFKRANMMLNRISGPIEPTWRLVELNTVSSFCSWAFALSFDSPINQPRIIHRRQCSPVCVSIIHVGFSHSRFGERGVTRTQPSCRVRESWSI